ncbi:MAG: formate dehydrogenase accessory sulfurtransferase FdhD [Phycisphaerales bacterium]|nr:MAG: formate dehydrogenase accessory sulfurtransferase FdhD [Phycisphaerales bacterium]
MDMKRMHEYSKVWADPPEKSICSTRVSRISSNALAENVSDRLIVEQALTVMVDRVGSFTIMCTPSDIEALAVGFVFSEGMIDGIDDVLALTTKKQLPNVVGIQIYDPSRIAIRRNLIVASSCGMCGVRNIDKMLTDIPPSPRSLEISGDSVIRLARELRSMQPAFRATGGSHAAGLFNADGEIITFGEDIGRHSALDKAIGKCLLSRKSMRGCGAVLSGRASFEMVAKAARAGLEAIVAVSAPSSFAIEAAHRWNITLCGFVRSQRANIYTHPERIYACQEKKNVSQTEEVDPWK